MQFPLLILMLENPEWLIILAIVLVLFGGSRLGQLGSALGESIREFKRATREESPPEGREQPDAAAPPPANIVLTMPPARAPAPGDYLPAAGGPQHDAPAGTSLHSIGDGAGGGRITGGAA